MRKRALKKKIGELESLLTDRREALGELVLGMHVSQSWDNDLLARGAAEVREVEDELITLEEETGERAGGTEESVEGAVPSEDGPKGDLPVGTFETAEHTMEHQIPEEETEASGKGTGQSPRPGPVEAKAPGVVEASAAPAPPQGFGITGEETESSTPIDGSDETKPDAVQEPAAPSRGATEVEERDDRSAPEEAQTEAGPAEGGDRKIPAAMPTTGESDAGMAAESPLDRLAERLDSEEKEARTGVDAARAAAKADARTETSAILESIERDRVGLQAALTAAAARIRAAEKRAEDAEAIVARKEAENREAAAGWVRSQAAEIEADAALASELATSAGPSDAEGRDTVALESEIETLKAAVETERREKADAIAAAEARLREIESKAREAEAQLAEGAATTTDSPSAAETREAAVDWLRGQIAALKKEIERSSERAGD